MPETTGDRMSARRRAATSLAATALVADAAEKLATRGIVVMPVKGALLQHWLYEDPSERPLTDVDLLVHPRSLQRAAELLEAGGYRRTCHSSVGGIVLRTPLGLMLDLHSQLFDRARYRLPTDEVFARSSEDDTLYGTSVRLPAPLDAYAHLIGKFGSDHLDARSLGRLDEISRMSARLEASPKTAARHLVHCGMGRIARYVLPLVQQTTGDVFALKVYRHLPFDPIGRGVVAIAHPILAAASPESRAGALVAHLLNESLPRGLRSGTRALIQQLRWS
ncbi:MAG: nucleotidyltransferase family protein [Polyangiales bacterium]